MAVDATAVARTTGIDINFVDFATGARFLPQQIAVLGQGRTGTTYSNDKRQVFSAAEVGRRYGFGSPLHLAVRELIPAVGQTVGTVPVYVLPLDDDASGVAATGSITPDISLAEETDSYRAIIGGIRSQQFVVDPEDALADIVTAMADAINGVLEMPVVATADTSAGAEKVDLEAKWAGESTDYISLSVEADGDGDTDFTIVAMNGGLVDPSVQPGLDQVPDDLWVTMVVNTMAPQNTDALDTIQTWGEDRWDPIKVKFPFSINGANYSTVANATAITSTRTDDRINAQVNVEGSPNMPVSIAAAAANPIARLANNNPPHDYGSRPMPNITPGGDSVRWDYAQRDAAVKGGSGTTEIKNGNVTLSDVVTAYGPEGEEPPAYRFVVDIVKLQNTSYNYRLEFDQDKWDGAPLIPDGQATVNPDAKKPSDAKAASARIVDGLANEAILSDPAFTKDNTVASIDSQNPKRLNLRAPVKLSGNTNIKAINIDFGFQFGG
jgi:phage tail sheath gpL-like